MGRPRKQDELFPHTRREIAERLERSTTVPKRIAHEYGVTVSMLSFIKKQWKSYKKLNAYFRDLGSD